MIDKSALENFVTSAVSELLEEDGASLSPDTVLLGKGSVMDSLVLVGLLVTVEDFCIENGIPFEWTADTAMSEKRSHYRTIGTLAEYLHHLSLASPRKD